MTTMRRAADTLAKRRTAAVLTAALVLGLGCAGAHAAAVAGPGGTAEQGRRLVTAVPAPGAEVPTLDLVAARLEGVDLAAGTVTIRGRRVPLHAEALRVLDSSGQVVEPRRLRAGQSVRLALEPLPVGAASPASAAAAAASRRIVLIYIDA